MLEDGHKGVLSIFLDPNKVCRIQSTRIRAVTTLSTKADDIARVLEDEIVGGLIAPGTVLRQEQLSERFDVSRTPVREALRRLAALGLVSFEPNRGVRVRSISRARAARGASSSAPSSRRSRPRSRRRG